MYVMLCSKVALTGQLHFVWPWIIYISNHFVKDGFSIHSNSTWFAFWDKECDIFSFKTIPKDILWTRLSKIVVSVEAITSGPLGSQRFWVWFQAEVIVF